MKLKVLIMAFLLVLAGLGKATACINFEINIGGIDNPEGHLFTEIIATLVSERTGVKVGRRYFKDFREMNEALAQKKVHIIVENTGNAMKLLNLPAAPEARKNFLTVKDLYERDRNLIWLEPFSFEDRLEGSKTPVLTAPVLARVILEKFPALPKLIGKLSGLITEERRSKMVKRVRDKGDKPWQVAKDFLSEQRLI